MFACVLDEITPSCLDGFEVKGTEFMNIDLNLADAALGTQRFAWLRL